MNLDSCTPGQRASIECVDGPLLVSAGAGSGKTFTLTQRIAYALLPESGPAAAGIDEVLAITFTEKAAAEIKARVKRTLRAEGLGDEALRVDGAWISTIHGMCARILRAHALELGIDPAFGIVGDAERADMVADAIDEALGQDNHIVGRGSYAALFDEFPARSALPTAPSVASMLACLLDRAVGLRGGLDALDFGPPPAPPSSLARAMLLAYEEVRPALEQGGKSAAAEKARVQACDAVQALGDYLARQNPPAATEAATEAEAEPGAATEATAGASAPSALRDLAAVVERCAYLPKKFGTAEVKAQVAAYQDVHAHVCREIALGLAWPRAAELLALAREVSVRYEAKKRAACKLDNDDLLVKTLAALEEHPQVAHRYADRFKLVMVDEFQDTSQLQIDLIGYVAGERSARLCTVGDAQQSIYRFRGADVNVYEAHKTAMRAQGTDALYVELTKNFRSHADVLSFVDRVFEQPSVFGEGFMSLAPHVGRASTYRGAGPRIDLVCALSPSGRNTGVGTDDAKRACARAIAERFAALRAQGHAPRDMVVLLGKMLRAEVYAQALRDEGFECAVTGGSLFASASEVRLVARLVEVLANPANTAALFEVLTSDLVHLSADDLLELATEEDAETGEMRRRDLDRGFARLAERTAELPKRLAHAVDLLARAQREVRTRPLSRVVQDTVVRSGWMARLQGQGAAGLAVAANVLKAVRMLEQLESERHLGLASAARAFSGELATGLKEAPGALSGAGGDVVKIMTIHASKGLEFPIVALADFAGAAMAPGKLVVETAANAARASLAAGGSLEAYPGIARRATGAPGSEEDADAAAARRLLEGDGPACDGRGAALCSQDAYRRALRERAAAEELAEARRKLYVGLTRASEALIVAFDVKAPSAGKAPSYPQLADDIRSALCGSSDFPEGVALLDFGGSEPARFERILVQGAVVPCDEETAVALLDASEPVRFAVPRMAGSDQLPRHPWSSLREEVFSYTSIAPSLTGEEQLSHSDALPGDAFDVAPAFEGDLPLVWPEEDEAAVHPPADADKATGLGSAFHRAAQFAVETGRVPDATRRSALADALGLSDAQRERFAAACECWFASAVYADAMRWPLRRAEVPFSVPLAGGYLEGEIDLLCTRGPANSGSALVVDYKTGGMPDERPDDIYAKHLLQAECYAYALLSQGIGEVELRFVRVERVQQGSFEPQVVAYRFVAADQEALRERIVAAHSASRS
ncbi:MAG: UvrD-helicase domain-containing protein [Gordonibacter sp.]